MEAHVDVGGGIAILTGWSVKRSKNKRTEKDLRNKSNAVANREERKRDAEISALGSVIFPLNAQPEVCLAIFIQANSIKHILQSSWIWLFSFLSVSFGSGDHHNSPWLCQSLLPILHASSLISVFHSAIGNFILQRLLHPLKDNIWILSMSYYPSCPGPC